VLSQREGGAILALGIAKWVVQLVMPVRLPHDRHPRGVGAGHAPPQRAIAALFLLIPLALYFAPQPQGPTLCGSASR
jgi:hypothetical protein